MRFVDASVQWLRYLNIHSLDIVLLHPQLWFYTRNIRLTRPVLNKLRERENPVMRQALGAMYLRQFPIERLLLMLLYRLALFLALGHVLRKHIIQSSGQ